MPADKLEGCIHRKGVAQVQEQEPHASRRAACLSMGWLLVCKSKAMRGGLPHAQHARSQCRGWRGRCTPAPCAGRRPGGAPGMPVQTRTASKPHQLASGCAGKCFLAAPGRRFQPATTACKPATGCAWNSPSLSSTHRRCESQQRAIRHLEVALPDRLVYGGVVRQHQRPAPRGGAPQPAVEQVLHLAARLDLVAEHDCARRRLHPSRCCCRHMQ